MTEPRRRLETAPDRTAAIFVVTALGAFMASLDLSIVNIAFPALQHAFPHDSTGALAWVITGYAIAFGALLVVAGRTADRLGARRMFFAGLGLFCLASALCGLAPSLLLLVAGRIVQGVGAAAMLPASLGLLLASVPIAKRTVTVTRWAGVGALAVATGPTLGALLVTAGGWRWVFYVNLPIGAAAWLAGRAVLLPRTAAAAAAWLAGRAVLLPRTAADPTKAAPDYIGALLVCVALGALVLGLTEGPTWGWTSAGTVGCLVAAVVVGAGFALRCARHPEPVLDLQLFASRSFSVANAAMVLYAIGFFGMLLGNILFLQHVWHYSVIGAGLAVTPGPLVVALVSSPAGKLASRIGFRSVLLCGSAVLAAGLLLNALRVGVRPDYVGTWLPSTLLSGLGIGLTFPVLGATAVSSLAPERFSVGSAVNQTARQVGGSIGVALLVVILGSSAVPSLGSFRHLWEFAAAMSILSGVICLLLPRRRAADAEATLAQIPATAAVGR